MPDPNDPTTTPDTPTAVDAPDASTQTDDAPLDDAETPAAPAVEPVAPVAAALAAVPAPASKPTMAELLKVTGEIRVAGIVINRREGGAQFGTQEGQRSADGEFDLTRNLVNLAVMGDDYRQLLDLETEPGEKVVDALYRFLQGKAVDAFAAPPQVPAGPPQGQQAPR